MALSKINNEERENALNQDDDRKKSPRQAPN